MPRAGIFSGHGLFGPETLGLRAGPRAFGPIDLNTGQATLKSRIKKFRCQIYPRDMHKMYMVSSIALHGLLTAFFLENIAYWVAFKGIFIRFHNFSARNRAEGSDHGLGGLAKMAFGPRAFGLGPGPRASLASPNLISIGRRYCRSCARDLYRIKE